MRAALIYVVVMSCGAHVANAQTPSERPSLELAVGDETNVAEPSQEAFAREAATSGAQVLQSSKIAQRTSRDGRVRAFAAQLSRDYAQANEELLLICRRNEIPLPTQLPDAPSMPDDAGSSFDRVYSLEMSQYLAKLQSLYAQAIEGAKLDPELEAFARQQAKLVRTQATQADALARNQAMR